MRAASKMAPLPRSSPKICDEWPCEPVDLDPPRAEPAAADDGGAGLVTLERERHVAAGRRLAQGRAALLVRPAGVLLVAGENDDQLAVPQGAGRVQRAQGLERDQVPALHVRDAAAVRAQGVPPEALALQHRVEVADQQQPLAARAAVLGHEVPAAVDVRLIHPARLEPERRQLLRVDLPDGPDARVVLRGARSVHRACEQRDRRLAPRVDAREQPLLARGELGARRSCGRDGQQEDCRNESAAWVVHAR